MTAVTWVAAVVLGVGSVGVFVFFLRDVSKVLPKLDEDDDLDHDGPAPM